MTNSSQDPETGATPDDAPATPPWVKVFGAIVGIVVLLVVILLLTRGPGGHGPGRHMPSGELGDAPAGSPTLDLALPRDGTG